MELLEGKSWFSYQKLEPEFCMSKEQYDELWQERPQEECKMVAHGKVMVMARRIQSYGHNYNFSGQQTKSKPFIPIIQYYVDLANSLDDSDDKYNMALVNWYENGEEYIGYHSDDERQLVPGSPICCFSFGAERDFLIKSIHYGDLKKYRLENNSLMIMGGNFQKEYKHSIPKRKKVLDSRISITLRKFKIN